MKSSGYSIKDLEVLSGVKAHTIRIWEKRYRLLKPERTNTNIRLYNDNDLKKMLNVSLLVRHGFKISKVAAWNEGKVRDVILEITKSKTLESDYIDRLIFCMVNFDLDGFIKLTDNVIERFGLEEAVFKIFFQLFIQIGTYWQVGSIFPAQEHFVAHIFRQKIIGEIEKLKNGNTRNSTVLFYLPENELHELSLLFYAFLAHKQGYTVIYLGQSVPFQDLTELSKHLKLDYIFTAFINSTQKEELEEYIHNLKELFNRQKVFITGGQIEQHRPLLPGDVKVIKDISDFNIYLG